MTTIDNALIFDSSAKRFRSGSISFEKDFMDVEFFDSIEDGPGLYVVPGFIDIHMHIESSMLTPGLFAKAVIPHGTTTIVSDCHEISNVAGLEGLKSFMEDDTPVDVFYAIPSSVPSSSAALETSNGSFDEEQVTAIAIDKRIKALGEVMNANDLFSEADNRTKRIIRAFKKMRPELPIEGHCPRYSGSLLNAFMAAGVDSDHCEQSPASIRERLSKGMFVELQYKGFDKDVIKALDDVNLDGHFSFCTDDVMPDVLLSEGHLDRVMRKAIALGMPVERVIYAATLAPAIRMRMFDRGMIAPGKKADFVIIDDINTLSISKVYHDGKCIYEKSKSFSYDYPVKMPNGIDKSIRRKPVRPEDFILRCPTDGSQRIMAVKHLNHTTMTEAEILKVNVKDGLVPMLGLNIVAQIERYGHEAPIIPVPLTNGLKKPGAICSSWAHDNHNLLVLATNPELAAQAVNMVIDRQGGIAAVDNETEFFLPLSYGGIVSVEPLNKLASKAREIRRWLKSHGYEALDEIMSFAVLGLPVSPAFKVTDKGLIDVAKKQIVNWRLDR